MKTHSENHWVDRIGWLRATVLGANDGIVSTASLIVGVAAAESSTRNVLLTGIAGLVAGAMSMAAGEYVSVSSQADTEKADSARERLELATEPEKELEELTRIYQSRGLERELAEKVAVQMTAHDAMGTHLRDELGMTEHLTARPIQAALASAAAFAVGAALPLAMVPLFAGPYLTWAVSGVALILLAGLGAVGAKAGGAPITKAVVRVSFWGAIAMAATAGIGALFGANVV
ncbi:MAG: VIT family protein [Pirellulaceae bacterium]